MYIDTLPLEKQLDDLALTLDKQIAVIAINADQLGIDPTELQNIDGTWALAGLLAAKAQTLHALALTKGSSNVYNIYNPGGDQDSGG